MLLTAIFHGHHVIGRLRDCKEKCSEVHQRQNQPICNPAYHIAVTFKLIMEFRVKGRLQIYFTTHRTVKKSGIELKLLRLEVSSTKKFKKGFPHLLN